MFPTEICFLSNVICTLSAKLKEKKYAVIFQNTYPVYLIRTPLNQTESNLMQNYKRFHDINKTGLP